MTKSCAKCQKTVYPLEQLNCLDKIWHKGCFKCSECGMTLNMKTYKGYNKLPYCEAHIPKAKATTVAETPELKRIQENTKIQSNACYHAEFEKAKGKFTQIVDDPELLRIKQNTKIISNVSYHGDLEKKAQMKQRRNLGEGADGDQNRNGQSPSYMDEIEALPQPTPTISSNSHNPQRFQQQSASTTSMQYGGSAAVTNTSAYSSHRTTSSNNSYQHVDTAPPPQHHSSSRDSRPIPSHQQIQQQHHHQQMMQQQHQQQRQSDRQYTNHSNPSPYSSRGQANVIYSSDGSAVNVNSSQKVGSIADYDPINNYFGSTGYGQSDPSRPQSGRIPSSRSGHGNHAGTRSVQQPVHQQQQQRAPPPPSSQQYHGPCYRALYDYEAQDVDEVSFADGDLIIDCTSVDEGWLTGTVQRSGQRGMLPANYVAPV